MRAALYARYSSDRQNERSIEDQLELARRMAQSRGWSVEAEFCDAAISGAAMANRPGLNAMLAAGDARAFDVVLVEDTDRLARDREHDAHIFKRLAFAGISISTFTVEKVGVIESTLKGLMNELYLVQLSEKTKRGVRSNAEKGLATGAKLYGYETQPGGATTIDPAQAEIIRHIHVLFADERLSVREIADRLNREGVPGPRGGYWNASTIIGERKRGNGVLRSEIYAGVKVWGRDEVRKDPNTGRRIHHYKPPEAWNRTPVEHLRIVPADLWARTEAQLDAIAITAPGTRAAHRKGLLSGLIKCGACGASYTSYSKTRLVCAAHRERGASVCANGRKVSRQLVEARTLEGIRTRMLSPAAVSTYVRAYHAAMHRLSAERRDRRRPLEKRQAELARQIERLVDRICEGTDTPQTNERLRAFEAEKAQTAAELQRQPADTVVEAHPGAADAYVKLVQRLEATLTASASEDADRKLIDSVRDLIDRIEVIPDDQAAGGVNLRLHGNLSLLLGPKAERKRNGQTPPGLSGGCLLVAGGGIEPPTCGL